MQLASGREGKCPTRILSLDTALHINGGFLVYFYVMCLQQIGRLASKPT